MNSKFLISFGSINNDKQSEFSKTCHSMEKFQLMIGSNFIPENEFVILKGNEYIGLLILSNYNDDDKNITFSIFLLPKHFLSHGLVLFKAIDFLFNHLVLHKLIIQVKEKNIRMRSLLFEIGINKDGWLPVLMEDGTFEKQYLYSFLHEEYIQLKAITWREVMGKCRN